MNQPSGCITVTPPACAEVGDDQGADGTPVGGLADFAGDYVFYAGDSGTFLDFEQLHLGADGHYTARVEATLVNPGVRSFGATCMLAEEGSWSAYLVAGKVRIRIRPTTSRARVYSASLDDGRFVLSRRGTTTTLFEDAVTVRPSGIESAAEFAGLADDHELQSA